MRKKGICMIGIICISILFGCGKEEPKEAQSEESAYHILEEAVDGYADIAKETVKEDNDMTDYSKYFEKLKITKSYKKTVDGNPLMTQSFGADPYGMVYGDTLYIYMTADTLEKSGAGVVKENTYSKIQAIHVVSTKDMVNFTDHGEIKVAGEQGATEWARNSWAPAAAWKEIDGKPRFFLYFADGGGGIGVLESDSPTGPFTDPIGAGLITRKTPNCADVAWLFDPAVLVDDDGRAYLYFGGGVPEGKAAEPGTGRVVELGEDMVSIKGEPQTLYAPYLFEDSGIHKAGNRYYYTYCSNFNVDAKGTEQFGFENGEIVCMVSDNPMGPFTYQERILENPGKYFGLSGNNHHCVFQFQEHWYITYHTRVLEQSMGIEKGYRCTFINEINMDEDGKIGTIEQNLIGCNQIKQVDAYTEQASTMLAAQGGISVVGADENSLQYGAGKMALSDIETGDFTVVRGVDFGHKNAAKIQIQAKKTQTLDDGSVIQIRLDNFKGKVVGYVPLGVLLEETQQFQTVTADLDSTVNGVHDLYFVYAGSGYELLSWQFIGDTSDWYDTMVTKSLVSKGTNGRLERVMAKLEQGQEVTIAYIGGSVTEGAGAASVTESYADQTVAYIRETYPDAPIAYINAGLGGTPSALGVMRYDRDVIDELGKAPDLLFLEFAVNDFEEVTGGRAYESMVKDILTEHEETAVVLVYAVFQSKWNMQDTYIPVGELYGLPMVSVKNATDYAYAQGKLTDEEYFSDEFHPTSYGHTIMKDCITYLLTQIQADAQAKLAQMPQQSVYGLDFQKECLLTSKSYQEAAIMKGGFAQQDTQVHAFFRTGKLAFADNWMCDGTTQEPFTMTVSCKNLLMNYKTSSDSDYGIAEVYVDGELVTTCNGYLNTGWNNSNVVLLLDEKESKEHTITIQMKEPNKKFTILAFGYTEE